MKLAFLIAALGLTLSARAGAQPVDWSADPVGQVSEPRPSIYAYPEGSDRFPGDLKGLTDGTGRVRDGIVTRVDERTSRVVTSFRVCTEGPRSDMDEPVTTCGAVNFDFGKQLTADLDKNTISVGSEVVAVLVDGKNGPEIAWARGNSIEYRIGLDGAVEVFLKRAASQNR
jgi:hypothetical protein